MIMTNSVDSIIDHLQSIKMFLFMRTSSLPITNDSMYLPARPKKYDVNIQLKTNRLIGEFLTRIETVAVNLVLKNIYRKNYN